MPQNNCIKFLFVTETCMMRNKNMQAYPNQILNIHNGHPLLLNDLDSPRQGMVAVLECTTYCFIMEKDLFNSLS